MLLNKTFHFLSFTKDVCCDVCPQALGRSRRGSITPGQRGHWTTFRCHCTKSNPIDDHSNISLKNVTEAEFQTIGPLYLHAVWYFPYTYSPRKHTVTYHFSDLLEVYSGNRQIHTKCQLQYLHPPHISTSGKCHCVIIHQTTKATEYIG